MYHNKMYINNDLKVIFLHNPKCGGVYIREILCNKYGFSPIFDNNNIHQNYDSFFNDSKYVKINEDIDSHTIREKGLYNYYESHQYINKEKLKKYFVFSFVRNPYDRFFSAYNYLKNMLCKSKEKNKIRNSYENILFFEDFETFVKNKENINNISFFHAFIPQYKQFLDLNNKCNINYIGRQENLDNDFLEILSILNIKNIVHTKIISDEKKMNESDDNDIISHYTEYIFDFVNKYFEKDFEIFGYKKYEKYKDFKNSFLKERLFVCHSNKNKILTSLKDLHILKYNKYVFENLIDKNKENFIVLFNYLNEMTNDKDKKKQILEEMLLFNEKINDLNLKSESKIKSITNNIWDFVKENNNMKFCDKCSKNNIFKSYNDTAMKIHYYFCK